MGINAKENNADFHMPSKTRISNFVDSIRHYFKCGRMKERKIGQENKSNATYNAMCVCAFVFDKQTAESKYQGICHVVHQKSTCISQFHIQRPNIK